MRLRIYTGTSVVDGCLDEEFKDISRQLIEKFKGEEIVAVISDLTSLELKNASQEVQDIFKEMPDPWIQFRKS